MSSTRARSGLDEHHDRTVAALRLADERVAELQAAERGAERQVASLLARIEALAVGLDRKDGAAWLQREPQPAQDFSARSRIWSGCGPATRRRWPRCWVRLPTPSPPTSFGAARSAVAALKAGRRRPGGDRARRLAGRRRRAQSARCPKARSGRSIWSRHAAPAARRADRDARRRRRGATTSTRRWTWWRRDRSCARSPPTATSSAPAGSAAGRTASRARWRSPPRSRRPAASWRPRRSRSAS